MTNHVMGFPGIALKRLAAFTLIEVMLVAGITSVLASIAIPNFTRMSQRAKASEAMTNLAAIRTAQAAHLAEVGTYVATVAVPSSVPGNTPAPWVSGTAFDNLGWSPEGQVLYQYLVSADDNGGGGPLVRFTAEAASDIDVDGQLNYWAVVVPASGETSGIAGMLPGSTCVGTGTYNAHTSAQDLLATVGPCDATAGRSKF